MLVHGTISETMRYLQAYGYILKDPIEKLPTGYLMFNVHSLSKDCYLTFIYTFFIYYCSWQTFIQNLQSISTDQVLWCVHLWKPLFVWDLWESASFTEGNISAEGRGVLTCTMWGVPVKTSEVLFGKTKGLIWGETRILRSWSVPVFCDPSAISSFGLWAEKKKKKRINLHMYTIGHY